MFNIEYYVFDFLDVVVKSFLMRQFHSVMSNLKELKEIFFFRLKNQKCFSSMISNYLIYFCSFCLFNQLRNQNIRKKTFLLTCLTSIQKTTSCQFHQCFLHTFFVRKCFRTFTKAKM